MIRRNNLFINWLLAISLLAQAFPVIAQDKLTKKPGADLKPAPAADAFLNVFPIALSRGEVEVSWKAGAPSGVTIKGFDVTLEVGLNDGKIQRLNRSLGGDVRTTTFRVILPVGPKGGGEIGSKNGNGAGPNNDANLIRCRIGCAESTKKASDLELCLKKCEENAGTDVTTRKFGEASISGGGKGGGAPEPGGKGGDRNPQPPFDGGNGGDKGGGLKPKPSADPSGIKSLRVTVIGRFSGGDDATVLREFAPPADKITGELIPKAARNRGGDNLSLQINKLIHISEIAKRAKECPAGQDCFEAIGQSRGGGQFKISLDVIYKNGQRRNVSRAVGALSRPILLSVEKPSNTELSSALVNIIAEVAADFSKSDTAAVGILVASPIGPIKK